MSTNPGSDMKSSNRFSPAPAAPTSRALTLRRDLLTPNSGRARGAIARRLKRSRPRGGPLGDGAEACSDRYRHPPEMLVVRGHSIRELVQVRFADVGVPGRLQPRHDLRGYAGNMLAEH